MVRSIFQAHRTPLLRGFLVWIPMLPADDRQAALEQAPRFQDERVTQVWDGSRALGRRVASTLQLAAPIAWDVYLLYPPGVTWAAGQLPLPTFWMHQQDEYPDHYLDPQQLESAVQKMLASIPNMEA